MRKRLKPIIVYLFFVIFFLILIKANHQVTQVEQTQEDRQIKTQTSQTASSENKLIQELMSKMTLEEKVGQLFWARVPLDQQIETLQTYQLGGYLLFGRDFEESSLDDVKTKIATYQESSYIPLLIGSDEEGGTVTRISSLLETPFQSPMTLYQQGGIEAIVEDTKQKARLLKSVGINAGLFPVADMAQVPESFIYDRTIGQDLTTTSDYVRSVVRTLADEKVASTLKHFPGYGDNNDSHTDIIRDDRPLESLRQTDFIPFQAGIAAGADSILVSHNIMTSISNVPSSISPDITGILRNELHFDGVIMTDDLDMAGLADFVSQEEAAFQVITAGNDLIISSTYDRQIPFLLDMIANGQLTEERIDQSVRRILNWKYKLGLLTQ